MTKKKYAPPKWGENTKRWKKNAYCNHNAKTFYSTKKSAAAAEKDITSQIEEWKKKLMGLFGFGEVFPTSRVREVFVDFEMDMQCRTSQSNWRSVCQRLDKWAMPIIGNMRLMDLNDGACQRVINYAYVTGHLSKKTLKNLRGDLSAFAKFCRKHNATKYRPEDIDIPHGTAAPEKKILQPDDLNILFRENTTFMRGEVVPEPLVYAFRLQVLHCLRPGEVGALKKSDRVGDVVHLQRSINFYKEITTGKNENAKRSFVLTELGKECWDKAAKTSYSDFLFPNFTSRLYRDHLTRFCEFHHMEVVTPYELRHTSFSVMQTLPEGLVKAVGGHSQSMDTFGIYGHTVDGDLQLTAAMIQERFRELLEKQGQNKVIPKKEQTETPGKSLY